MKIGARKERINEAYESMEAGRFERSLDLLTSCYLGGEETDIRLILGIVISLKESGKLQKARDMLIRHCSLFEKYKDVYSAAGLLNEIDAALAAKNNGRKTKIAVLSDATIHYLVKVLEFKLKSMGIIPEIYEAPFGQVDIEILKKDSELYRFNPEILFVIYGGREIDFGGGLENARKIAHETIKRLHALWNTVHNKLGCQIIQNNLVPDPWVPAANAEGTFPGGKLTALRYFNVNITEDLPHYVTVLDLEELASGYGRWKWWDNRYYYSAKIPFAMEAIPDVAAQTAALIGDLMGLSPKCLMVDLDNTIWGGVLGEVGMREIELGPTPEGEAYLDIQRYLKGLTENGFLLSVCSKNDPGPVREVFEKHEHMILRPDDISAWRVNWRPKSENIREIADELNLGLDSFVVLDDNPAEREEIRKAYAEVTVPRLPPDPGGIVSTLVKSRLFEKARISEEDKSRKNLYKQRRQIEQFLCSTASHEEFLSGLEMKTRVELCTAGNISRIHQLINKTNQFNLTTRRMSMAELKDASSGKDALCLGFYMEDKFGSHGLVGVLIARIVDDKMGIDNFLISCRVIGRTLEKAMLQVLAEEASKRGISVLQGKYVSTSKNSLVKDLYEELGFKLLEEREGVKNYSFKLSEHGDFQGHYLRVNKTEEDIND